MRYLSIYYEEWLDPATESIGRVILLSPVLPPARSNKESPARTGETDRSASLSPGEQGAQPAPDSYRQEIIGPLHMKSV
jgi:hypothetical protein